MRVLELFACEGGATEGYMNAGYYVVAVDNDKNRIKYNPADQTIIADAFDILRNVEYVRTFDLVHMSPPCQGYSRGNAGRVTDWPRLIPECRDAVADTGVPYVIENVIDAEWAMVSPLMLCGCMFDLTAIDDDGIKLHMQRQRLFETSFWMNAPRRCDHSEHEWVAGAYGGARRDKYEAKYIRRGGYVPPNIDVVQDLLGVKHRMTWRGLFESIPPVYAEYVGNEFRKSL